MHTLGGLSNDLGSHHTAEIYFDGDIVRIKIIMAFDHRLAPRRWHGSIAISSTRITKQHTVIRRQPAQGPV